MNVADIRDVDEVTTRFMARLHQSPSCWLWTAGKSGDGYGAITVRLVSGQSRQMRAHRLAFVLFRGPVDDHLEVCHNCPDGDNPACVNPDHLFIGTHADNMRDRYSKGRFSHTSGAWTSPTHKLCRRCNALKPRSDFYRNGSGQGSYCKRCERERAAERYARNPQPHLAAVARYAAKKRAAQHQLVCCG